MLKILWSKNKVLPDVCTLHISPTRLRVRNACLRGKTESGRKKAAINEYQRIADHASNGEDRIKTR